jgi:hypothetical protein
MTFPAQVQAAIVELTTRTKAEIEAETAWKWAARAVAALRLSRQQTDLSMAARCLPSAIEYGHEAIEHAASAGVEVLIAVRDALAAESPQLFGEGQ